MLLLASGLVLASCGETANDVEVAITDHAKWLTEPECKKLDRDLDEAAYECSAAQKTGRRIKLMVYLKSGDAQLIMAWPCVSADRPWRVIRRNPDLHCGIVIWSGR
ncbi:MAG: hypothetical protein ACJ75T_00555 [Solirubrobacterales bacterium]